VRKNGTAILAGEYNLTSVLLKHGVDIDCLLKSYQGIDWRDKSQWECNNKNHPPSRRDTYFGMSMHPLETMFHKSHWRGQPLVLDDYVEKYISFDDENFRKRAESKVMHSHS
jgi:hypothetical protein